MSAMWKGNEEEDTTTTRHHLYHNPAKAEGDGTEANTMVTTAPQFPRQPKPDAKQPTIMTTLQTLSTTTSREGLLEEEQCEAAGSNFVCERPEAGRIAVHKPMTARMCVIERPSEYDVIADSKQEAACSQASNSYLVHALERFVCNLASGIVDVDWSTNNSTKHDQGTPAPASSQGTDDSKGQPVDIRTEATCNCRNGRKWNRATAFTEDNVATVAHWKSCLKCASDAMNKQQMQEAHNREKKQAENSRRQAALRHGQGQTKADSTHKRRVNNNLAQTLRAKVAERHRTRPDHDDRTQRTSKYNHCDYEHTHADNTPDDQCDNHPTDIDCANDHCAQPDQCDDQPVNPLSNARKAQAAAAQTHDRRTRWLDVEPWPDDGTREWVAMKARARLSPSQSKAMKLGVSASAIQEWERRAGRPIEDSIRDQKRLEGRYEDIYVPQRGRTKRDADRRSSSSSSSRREAGMQEGPARGQHNSRRMHTT